MLNPVLLLNPVETKAAVSLAIVFLIRMMGLFMLLPVLAILARDLTAATPFLVGVAIGAYGLFQALLQIPFGVVSDRFGRKKIIVLGLLVFVFGSLIAAFANDIWGVIAGRALQGAGAISAVVMALAADLTREAMRTRVMAILGASIGLSFILSIVLGPLLMNWLDLSGIFFVIAALGVVAALLVIFVVPEPPQQLNNRDMRVIGAQLGSLVRDPGLLRLDIGICVLHMIITASFVCIPLSLLDIGIAAQDHWPAYLLAIGLSLLVMLPLVGFGERKFGARLLLLAGIAGLAAAQIALASIAGSYWGMIVALALFFGFLSVLEALLPSLVSRLAPAAGRGSAMGVYSTSQFFGAFLGGILGGWLLGETGTSAVYWLLALACLCWLPVASGVRADHRSSAYHLPLKAIDEADIAGLTERLRAAPGVMDVVVGDAEKIAYLKIDKASFDEIAAMACLKVR